MVNYGIERKIFGSLVGISGLILGCWITPWIIVAAMETQPLGGNESPSNLDQSNEGIKGQINVCDCANVHISMTDDNVKDVLRYFGQCRNLTDTVAPSRRAAYSRAVAKQLKRCTEQFLYSTRLPRTKVRFIRQKLGKLYYDMVYADETGEMESRPRGNKLRDQGKNMGDPVCQESTPCKPQQVPCGTTTEPELPEDDECQHAAWEMIPSVLIYILLIFTLIMSLIILIAMCLRFCQRKDPPCCHGSEMDLEECLQRILNQEKEGKGKKGDKNKDKKKKKKQEDDDGKTSGTEGSTTADTDDDKGAKKK